MAEDPLQLVPWPLVLAGASILVVLLFFRRRADVFRGLAMSRAELAILCLGPVAGLSVNIPLYQAGGGVLAVNLGGALLPLLMTALWLRRGRLDAFLALAGTLVVSGIAKVIVTFDPETGIYTTFPALFAPSLVALAFAMAMTVGKPLRAVPLAYTAGSMGALLGADLYNLAPILESLGSSGVGVVSIGGAGVFDMVYLAGMVAMAGALLLAVAMQPRLDAADGIAYPPALERTPEPALVWARYQALADPNARERALAALALSDLHLRRRDYARALAHSVLAVDALLADPRVLERVREQASPALRRDLEALQAAHRASAPWQRRAAGNANHAAKLAVAALAPLTLLPSRLGSGGSP
ncbi:MAG TPA: DUF1614 domain-containing protein [Candidatus Thermoplasmatota archaeon]|nr:DUF1614 domain-containing protein [Candidatus Thermoplasmatota archaeon]